MEFDLITDVPEAIADFYQEEVRNEATGEYTSETYGYEAFDNDGELITQTGTRQVAEYVDNIYVVQKTRCQPVSWDKVISLIEKHAGNKDQVIDTFIGFAIETASWEFCDSYIDWLDECAEVDTYNETEQLGEEGTAIEFTPQEYPEEPQLVNTTLAQWKLANYNVLRRAAYGSYESQLEMQFDGTWEDFISSVKDKYPKA